MGLVLRQMVQAIRYFLEFCYLVRWHVIDDNDLDKLDKLLAMFHEVREIFQTEGVWRKGFNLPRQHALTHYRDMIIEYGAPNGYCSSITELLHKWKIKDAYQRSNQNEPLSQILTVNQRIDKLDTVHRWRCCGSHRHYWRSSDGSDSRCIVNDLLVPPSITTCSSIISS